MRESKYPKYLRLKMVQTARREGIKAAARIHACSANTVRKWIRRYDGKLTSLESRSRAPLMSPNKLSAEAEQEIIAAKKKLPSWGAARLKRDMDLPYSEGAIRRVLREHGLNRKYRRKKHQTKNYLRRLKKTWALWQQLSVDTKHLMDMPEYWLQARKTKLPKYQYTAREVSTGALFLSFADELSLTYANLFIERIVEHLKNHEVHLGKITIQTDNGSEFIGSWQAVGKSAFTRTIEEAGATHKTIPPRAYTWQSDVETVHGLMETEFYIERFRSRKNFLDKAATYQNYFNYSRPNSGKENKAPFDLIKERNPKAPLDLLYLPPVYLNDLFRQSHIFAQGVHDVSAYP
jgi:transposase